MVTATSAAIATVIALCVALAPTAQATDGHVRTGALCPDTHTGYRCMADVSLASSLPGVGWSPAQLRSAYGLTNAPAPAAGTAVAVVDAYWAPSVANQLAAYCAQFGNGCSSSRLSVVDQRGNPVSSLSHPPKQPTDAYDRTGSGWSQETAMDVQMVAAVCPSCNIVLVSADSDDRGNNPAHMHDLETAVQIAAASAHYVSMSWGTDEDRSAPSYDKSVLGRSGVIYTAAAGDWAGDLPIWPAVSPRAVAVGGTRLTRTSTGWNETAWSDGGSACAVYEAQPSWQRAFGAITSACGKRAAADLAVVGDPAKGVAVCLSGSSGGCSEWARVGGTSVGAPLVAAMYALAGNHSQLYAPYAHVTEMRDVTGGSNAVPGVVCGLICTARTGWDGPTGLGAPRSLKAFQPGLVLRNPGPVTAWKGTTVNWDLSSSGVGSARTTDYVAAAGSALPPNTSFDPSTGHITGRPTAIGSGYFTVTVTTAGGQSSTRLRWVVRNKVTIAPIHRRASAVGTRIAPFSVRAADTTPGLAQAYRARYLPPGVQLNKVTGRFTGKVNKVGTYHVVITVRDSTGGTGTTRFTWRVNHRFVRTSPTSISGSRSAGATLTVLTGTLRRDTTAGPITTPIYHFRWYLDGKPIKGATHRSLAVRQQYRGHTISVQYRAVRPGYSTYRKTISTRIT